MFKKKFKKSQTKTILILILALVLVGITTLYFVLAESPNESWTIDGNAVYMDDERAYIRAEPHTLTSSDWVYFNITSKLYEGDIDIVFGFDTDTVKPSKIEFYNPQEIIWNTTSRTTFYNVTSLEDTDADCDYGFEYNLNKKNGTHYEPIIDGEYTIIGWNKTSTVVCFDSYEPTPFIPNLNYTLTWHEEHSRIKDYVDKTEDMTSIEYEHGGMNKWWYIKNISINANQNYMFRGYVNVPISLTPSSGKYWFAIKRSSDTIQEAIESVNFYALDPWWNSSWGKCKDINITSGSTTNLLNFPVYLDVSYDADMLTDFSDIRFVNSSCADAPSAGVGGLDYEIENYTVSNTADVWVKIPTFAPGVNNFSMYYDNAEAISGENPSGVWDNGFIGVWHNTEVDANDSTSYNNNGTETGGVIHNSTGIIDGGNEFDGGNDFISMGDQSSLEPNNFTISGWIKIRGDGSHSTGVAMVTKGQGTSEPYYSLYLGYVPSGNDIRLGIGKTNNQRTEIDSTITFTPSDTPIYLTGTYNRIDLILYVNGEEEATVPQTLAVQYGFAVDNFYIGQWGGSNSRRFEGLIDEVRISNINRSADWINMSYQIVINQSTHVVWGDEVEAPIVDTCTYSSGTWEVDCSDDCVISGDVDLGGDDMTIIGEGTFTTTADILNFGSLLIVGDGPANKCLVYCMSGGCFKT